MAETFSFEEAQGTRDPERFIPPDVQAARDVERVRIVQAEYDKEADPDTRAALGRELGRIKGVPSTFSFEEAQKAPSVFSFEEALGAERPLPEGMKPSTAGAGRGKVNPPLASQVRNRGGVRSEAQAFGASEQGAGPGRGFAEPPLAQDYGMADATGTPIAPDAMQAQRIADDPMKPEGYTGRQAVRDFKGGIETVKAIGEGVKAYPSSALWKEATNTTAGMDAIDAGQRPPSDAVAGGVSPFMAAYAKSAPDERAQMRAEVADRLSKNQEFLAESVKHIKGYLAEAKKQTGRLPEFTDIRTVREFGVWLARNGINSSPTMAASMIGAAFGLPGLAVTSMTTAIGDMTQGHAAFAGEGFDPKRFKNNPDRFDDATAQQQGLQAQHLGNAASTTAALAPLYAAGDAMGPEMTMAMRGLKAGGATSIKDAIKRGMNPSRVGKALGYEALGEGPIQEGVNIASEIASGEHAQDFTGQDAKRIVNAGAAGAAGAFTTGHPINVATEAYGAARENAALGKAAESGDIASAVELASRKGQLRPTQQRRALNDRLDDIAAEHGLSQAVIDAAKKHAETKTLAEVPGFYKRYTAAVLRRLGRENPEAATAALDEFNNPAGQDFGDSHASVQRGVTPDGVPWEIFPDTPGGDQLEMGDIDELDRTARLNRADGDGAPRPFDGGRSERSDVPVIGRDEPELDVVSTAAQAGRDPNADGVRPALDAARPDALSDSPRILTRAGTSPQTAAPIELRPDADGSLAPYMDGKPMLDRSGAPVVIPADATDLQAKQAIRKAGAISDRLKFFAPGKAALRAAQPAVGDNVTMEGQAYTVEHTSNGAARLRDARGRIRAVSLDSDTWATATMEPPAQPAAIDAERATFDTREAAEHFLSEQRRAGGARQGRALPVATADGRWTFARAGEPAFAEADRLQEQRDQQQPERRAAINKPRQPETQAAAQRERVLRSLHEHMAKGGSLTTGIRKAGKALGAEDKGAILDRARALRADAITQEDSDAMFARAGALLAKGMSVGQAGRRAVEEHIGEVLPDLVLREPGAEYTAVHGQPDPDAQRVREAESKSSPRGQGEAASGRPVESGPTSVVPVRGSASPLRSRPRVVGLGIAAEIERVGSAALVGRQVNGPDQLAELAQVYRDPRYETFRAFFVKDNAIVHATGISARMPGYAPMAPADMSQARYVQWFKDQMEATGADGYYLLHNHPSGNPSPSAEDERLTAHLAAQVPGMRAHVVINSGKYAVISPTLDRRTEVLPIGEDTLLKASKPHPLIGFELHGPAAAMLLGKALQKDNFVTLVGTDNQQKTRVIVEAPSYTLQRPYPVLGAILRRTMRMSGSNGLFLVGSDPDIASAPVQRALAEGLLLDAIGATGRTQTERGARGGRGFQETKGRYVAEPQDGGRGSDDGGDGSTFEPAASAGRTLAHYRGMALQALGRRQLVELYEGDIPQLRAYSDMVQRMDAEKNDASAQADGIARDWAKLKDEQALARLMHDATLAGIDPAEHKQGELGLRFKGLGKDAQAIYVQARDGYREHFLNVEQALGDRIRRADMSSERRQRLLQHLADNFKELTEGVYFPLARFGDYMVIVRNADGQAISVSRAETLNEADALRRSLVRQFKDEPGATVSKVLKDREFSARSEGVSPGFLGELYDALEKEGVSADLMDNVGQLYLSSLPDLSWAKHGLHRKKTPGFSQDARRSFASYMFHGASHLAKVRYADRLQGELEAMQKHVGSHADEDSFDPVRAQQVVDEMIKRHDLLMNPRTHPVSTALTSLGFVFHLGLSPASAMVNLAQTPLVAFPLAGAKWGFPQAAKELGQASAEIAAHGGTLADSLKGDEADAYREAARIGLIDVTLAHDLAGVAAGEDAKVHRKLRPVMRAASWLFHHAERINREATFIAGYRLARKAGADAKQALDQAVQLTYDSHFDYSASNRPRIMQGNWQRVILLFKQFAQNMIFTLARQAQQSLKGATPEARSQARKALAGLLVMHASAAGVLGLPLVGMLLEVASMIGSDDDEPWDAETALRNMLADAFGQKPAEVLARGLSRLTPWDVSGRVGLDRLLLPDVFEGLDGQRAVESWFASALGPVAGIAVNVGRGLEDIGKGHWVRGLEDMMPSALRGPLRAYRFATEGANDRSGAPILDEVSSAAIVGQVLGLSPSALRNAQEGRSAVFKADRELTHRRSKLLNAYARAEMAEDEKAIDRAQDAIDRWNDKQPDREIDVGDQDRSVDAREKRIEEAQSGIYLPDSRRGALDAGRFALQVPAGDAETDDE